MFPLSEDDSILIQAIRKGNTLAFETIYHRYKKRLFLFAIKIIKSDELAEELIHDIFLKIWEGRENLDPTLSFNSYLHTICKNHIFNLLKKAARDQALRNEILLSAVTTSCSAEETFLFEEYSEIVNKAINNLPPRRKLIFQMCKLEGKSYEEVSRNLGVSKNAVKEHIIKATRYVKEYFKLHTDIAISIFLTLANLF